MFPSRRRSPTFRSWADITYTLDDDRLLAILKEKSLSSLAPGPSTLKRVPPVKKRAEVKDSGDLTDEDLPHFRVKGLLIKHGRLPVPFQFKHIILKPATAPMECIVPLCPFDWHEHISAAISHEMADWF